MGPVTDADEISRIAFGFMGSQALFTALDHGLFTVLAEGALDAEALADRTGLHRDRAETLLTALAGLGLVTVSGGRFANSPAAEAFLVKGAKYDFGDYLRLQVGKQMYGLMGQLGGAVSGTLSEEETGSYEQWFSDPEEARLYSESQHAGSHGPARQMTRRVDLSGAKTLLDVGGGTEHDLFFQLVAEIYLHAGLLTSIKHGHCRAAWHIRRSPDKVNARDLIEIRASTAARQTCRGRQTS